MLRSLVALFSMVALASFSLAQAPLPLQMPAVNLTHIAFVYAGEIWLVERQGAKRTNSSIKPERKSRRAFRPTTHKSPSR